MGDMPCEDAMGLLYLLQEDGVEADNAEALAAIQAKEAAIMMKLMAPFRQE